MANKFTGITSAGVNVPVYDKEAHQALGNVYTKSEVDTELNTKQDNLSTEQLYNIDHALTTSAGLASEAWVNDQGFAKESDIPTTAGLMEESKLNIDSNHITAYNGIPFSAQGGGGATYEGIAPIVVDNTENKISANSFEIEMMQVDHDDTLVHTSTTDKYVLGVNTEKLDTKTLLFSANNPTSSCTLSDNLSNYEQVKIMFSINGNCQINEFCADLTDIHKNIVTFGNATDSFGWGKQNLKFEDNKITVTSAWAFTGLTANNYDQNNNQYAMNSIGAIWGINRKEA
ncbi:MAG: hypothetical protein MJZ37_06955 [Bacilli bacterium]|nr:hypothetical protein [Bacilli bacterium]